MVSNTSDQKEHNIAHYQALKTAIANGEEQLVKELLANETMQPLEQGYLLDLANLNGNATIIRLLKAVPVEE